MTYGHTNEVMLEVKKRQMAEFKNKLRYAGVKDEQLDGLKMPRVPAVCDMIIEIARGGDPKVAEHALRLADYYERQISGKNKTIENLRRKSDRMFEERKYR